MRSTVLLLALALQQMSVTNPPSQEIKVPHGLIEAAEKGDIERIRNYAGDPGFAEKDADGRTALVAAGEKGQKKAFAELIAVLDDRVKQAVKRMISAGQSAVADGMAAVQARMIFFNSSDSKGVTPLMYAASHGWSEIVVGMLEGGADPSLKDRDGRSPADHAQDAGYDSIAATLRDPPRE